MPASVTDPSGYGVWEPQKDLKTGKIYWTNHALQKTAWDPPRGGTAVVQQAAGHAPAPPGATPQGTSEEKQPGVGLAVAPGAAAAAPGAAAGAWGQQTAGAWGQQGTAEWDSNQQQQLLPLQQVHGDNMQVMGTHRMLHKLAPTRATGTRQILATTSSMQQQAMRRSKRPALLPQVLSRNMRRAVIRHISNSLSPVLGTRQGSRHQQTLPPPRGRSKATQPMLPSPMLSPGPSLPPSPCASFSSE